MNYLLDTHTFLWFLNDDEKLSKKANKLIQDKGNRIFISMASIWEIAIKVSNNKLKLLFPLENISKHIFDNDFNILNISIDATTLLAKLPFNHRDPFDRLLVAQAMAENLAIISKDEDIKLYKVKTVW